MNYMIDAYVIYTCCLVHYIYTDCLKICGISISLFEWQSLEAIETKSCWIMINFSGNSQVKLTPNKTDLTFNPLTLTII